MKMILCLALVASCANASNLFDYTVYTKNGISAECSDFLGKTGANGPIYLRDFLIQTNLERGCALESSETVYMVRGSIQQKNDYGCVRAKKFSEENTGYSLVRRYNVDFAGLDQQVDQLSRRLTELEARATVQVVKNAVGAIELYKITQGDLLIVKVLGTTVTFKNLGILLNETVNATNVVWHFPEAELITLTFSGAPQVGIPGTIVAPKAKLVMNNALVTGAVYVRTFVGKANTQSCNDKVSGQVNPACLRTEELGLGCVDPLPGGKG